MLRHAVELYGAVLNAVMLESDFEFLNLLNLRYSINVNFKKNNWNLVFLLDVDYMLHASKNLRVIFYYFLQALS